MNYGAAPLGGFPRQESGGFPSGAGNLIGQLTPTSLEQRKRQLLNHLMTGGGSSAMLVGGGGPGFGHMAGLHFGFGGSAPGDNNPGTGFYGGGGPANPAPPVPHTLPFVRFNPPPPSPSILPSNPGPISTGAGTSPISPASAPSSFIAPGGSDMLGGLLGGYKAGAGITQQLANLVASMRQPPHVGGRELTFT